MAQIETWYNQDLKQPVKVHYLHGNVFSQDNQGNILGVNVFDDGSPASLSGTVSAYIIRSDGATVPATGSISGNKASVALPEAAYAIPGIISVVMKLTAGAVVVTLLAVVATVYASSTDTAADPGTIIPSVQDLIEAINEAVESIPPDYSDLTNAVRNDVFGIRNLLKAEDVLSTVGKFIGAYGVIGDSANHIVSDFVYLLNGDTVAYNLAGSDSSVVLVCEYNTDETYRNVIAVGAGSTTAVTGTYTAPKDVLLRFCCRKDYAGTIVINNGSPFTVNSENGIFENVGFSKGLLDINDVLSLSDYCIRASNGELVSTSNYFYSDFIRFETGDVVEYSLRGSDNSISLFALYNKDKAFLKNVALGVQYQTDVTGSFTIPFSCYARFCNRKDNPNGYITINGGIPNGIKEYVKNYVPFPDYWKETVEQKIETYNAKNAIVGKNGISFAFISDTHWGANAQHSTELLNYIFNHTNLNKLVHGGDHTINSLSDIRDFVNAIEKPIDYIPCVGNHEFDSSLQFTNAEIWSCGFKRSESIIKHSDGFNYCYDDEFQKVRFIVLNYNDQNCVNYLDEYASELDASWAIIVVCHEYWGDRSSASDPITPAVIGTAIANTIDANSNVWAATVALFLVGHIHQDKDTTTQSGVPIVSINCDAYEDGQSFNWGGYKMTRGTTTEQCFDLVNIDTANKVIYMTRVGAGSDRQFSY